MFLRLLLLGFLLSGCLSFAQQITGSVTGTVTDPAGAAVIGAEIKLTNTGTSAVQTARQLLRCSTSSEFWNGASGCAKSSQMRAAGLVVQLGTFGTLPGPDFDRATNSTAPARKSEVDRGGILRWADPETVQM